MQRHLRTHDVGHWARVFLTELGVPDGGRARRSTSIATARTGAVDPSCAPPSAGIARVPQLLVACDYDGTLAPIVEDPTTAVPLPEAVAAVRALAALPQTTVAVVSGRALRDLAALSRLPSEVHLVGSHGSEFDIGFVERLAPELVELRTRLQTRAARDRRGAPGRTAGEQAGQRRGAHCARRDPDVAAARSPTAVARRPGDLARRHVTQRQGGHRAVGDGHPQGHRARRAAHPALGQRGALPRRRRHRRERVRQPARPRPRRQDRRRARRRRRYRVADAARGGARAGAAAGDPARTGSSASGPCRSSGTRCSPTGAPSRCSPPTPR